MTTALSVDRGVALALADAALKRRSGIVTALRGKHKCLFCLEDGVLVFAASNVIEEQFSEALVRDSLLSVGDLAGAQLESERRGSRLTRVLLSEKTLAEEALMAALESHFRDLLYATLDWSDGESTFTPGKPDLDDEVTTRLACVPLLFEYARLRPTSITEVRTRVGSPGARLRRCEERMGLLDSHELEPRAGHLLGACDGSATITDMLERLPGDEEGAWRALYGLTLLGLVEPAVAARVEEHAATREEIQAQIQHALDRDFYGILDVPSTAPRDKILQAYYVLARKYHPDRYRTGPLSDLREPLESYFAQVTQAYNTLYDSRLRAEYDEQLDSERDTGPVQDTAYLAQENFRRAQGLIARGRFTDAVTSLENAIKLAPRNAEYRLEAGRLLGRNPRLREQAVTHLIQATSLDPSLADGYYELGELYLKMGRRDEALELFRETLRWETGHVQASARIRESGKG